MADAGYQTIGRWAMAAICAAAISLAQAQPHGQAHAASVSFRQSDSFASGGLLARPASPRRAFARQPDEGFLRMARNYPESRSASPRPGSPARHSQRLLPPAGGIPYRPVSDGARNVPRPPSDTAYMRAGSIRDAVTRYNEERETGRTVPRPPATGGRTPDPALYRN